MDNPVVSPPETSGVIVQVFHQKGLIQTQMHLQTLKMVFLRASDAWDDMPAEVSTLISEVSQIK